MATFKYNSSDIILDDDVLEQVLNDAKPFLKRSLKDWFIKHSDKINKQNVDAEIFQLTFDEFSNLSEQKQRNWRHHVLKEKKDWLNDQLRIKRAEWILILGGKIELASSNLADLPKKDEIFQIAKVKGFAPFVYIKEPLIEEQYVLDDRDNWSSIDENDFYPTIKIFIAEAGSNDEEIINKKNEMVADFDTGSPIIVLDQQELMKRNISLDDEIELSHIHLGKTYDFHLPFLKVGIYTIENEIKTKPFRVQSVLNWKQSPFCYVNPTRSCLVGRNLLLESNLQILLNGHEKRTQILK